MAKKSSKKQKQETETAVEVTAVPSVAFDAELDAFFKVPAASTVPVPPQPTADVRTSPLKRKEIELESSDEEQDDLSEASDPMFSDSEDEEPSTSSSVPRPVTTDGYVPPVHEAMKKRDVKVAKSAKFNNKFVEVDEPRHLKDKRTLFLGNLPMQIVKDRPMQKRLTRLIESLSPYRALTKASNLRFRSVAFSVPTASTELDEAEEDLEKRAKKMERSQNYKEALAAVEGGGSKPQKPLTAQQKRKIAFINQDVNEKAASVSAYLTIAHPQALVDYLYRVAPPKAKGSVGADASASSSRLQVDTRLTGPVLTALVAAYADGQLFEDRHLRVDLVAPLDPSEVVSSGIGNITTIDGSRIGTASPASGTKQTIFVGGLDFEANEEDVRSFFENLVVEERGAAQASTIDVLGLDAKPPSPEMLERWTKEFPWLAAEKHQYETTMVRQGEWVRSVRIVRDKATQLGKGIAYVRFADQQCVDEIIAISQTEEATLQAGRQQGLKGSLAASSSIASGAKEFKRRLKLRGRPVRVSRCKAQTKSSGEGRPVLEPPSTPQRGSSHGRYDRAAGAPTPNGTSPHSVRVGARSSSLSVVPPSPLSAKEIADKADLYSKMSKDERIQHKKQDSDRAQRRLAKKGKKAAPTDASAARIANHKSLFIEGEKARRKERVKLKQPSGAPSAKGANGKGKGRIKASSASSKPASSRFQKK